MQMLKILGIVLVLKLKPVLSVSLLKIFLKMIIDLLISMSISMNGDLLSMYVKKLILIINLKDSDMQCKTPKLIRNKDFGISIYIPCGKCYSCLCNKRAEWVLRTRCEYDKTIKNGGTSYFCTFTYDDDHLFAPQLPYNTRRLILQNQLLRAGKFKFSFDGIEDDIILDDPFYDELPDYGDFLLNKEHASDLLCKLQNTYRNYFFADEFKIYKHNTQLASRYANNNEWDFACYHKELAWNNRPPLVRFYLVGEYGDLSNRPHLHSLFFFPNQVNELDLANILKSCWSFGDVHIGYSVEVAAINYVAKHQVKDCLGSEFQQKVAPIFALTSKYQGGIGYDLRFDPIINYKYQNREYEEQSLKIVDGSKEFYFAFPRYVKKFLHPLNLTIDEFSALQLDTYENYNKILYQTAFEQGFDCTGYNIDSLVYSYNLNKQKQQFIQYKENKRLTKLLKNGFKIS